MIPYDALKAMRRNGSMTSAARSEAGGAVGSSANVISSVMCHPLGRARMRQALATASISGSTDAAR
jgi:hypothetical protein